MNSMFATVGWRYVDLKYKTAFDHFENLQRWRNCQNLYGVYKQTPEEEFKAAGLEDVHDSIENTTSSYWSNDPEGCRRHNFFELLFERKYRNDSCELRKFLKEKGASYKTCS